MAKQTRRVRVVGASNHQHGRPNGRIRAEARESGHALSHDVCPRRATNNPSTQLRPALTESAKFAKGTTDIERSLTGGCAGQFMPISWALHQQFILRMQIDSDEKQSLQGDLVKSATKNLGIGVGLVAIGIAVAAAGIYIGDTDDAPGAALIGIVVMIATVVFGVRTARRKTF